MDKIILHSDLNNFYASCECTLNPALKNVPMAVCGDSEKRHGVILAKNQLAKAFGVKTAESKVEALKKCPHLTLVPPRHELYEQYSKRVRNIYYSFTDRIEPFGLDECWLDVTGSTRLFGSGEEIAEKIRNSVKEQTGLTVSVGVSFSKTFAKLGSDMKKPDAVTVISRENYRSGVWRLPVQDMLYVGTKTAETLKKFNVVTIGDLATAGDSLLKRYLGVNGFKLKAAALGENDDEVSLYENRPQPKSVGHGTTTYRDMTTNAEIRTVIYSLSDLVAARLRRYGLNANGVQLFLKDSAFQYFSRQQALPASTLSAKTIAGAAYRLFEEHYDLTKKLPVRAIAVYTYHLTPEKRPEQLDLFASPAADNDKMERLEKSIDLIRQRYGASAVTRAGFLQNQYVADTFEGDDDSLPFRH